MKNLSLIITAFILTALLNGCGSNKEVSLQDNFKKHIEFLASDDLEGREAGSEGELKAANYVASVFKDYGLSPKGTEGFLQPFEFLLGKSISSSSLVLDSEELSDDINYFPMNFSGNGVIDGDLLKVGFGIEAPDLEYNDFEGLSTEGKIHVMKISSPDGIHPHSKYIDYHGIRDRVKVLESKGALAVLLVNNDNTAADPVPDYTEKMATVGIPVLFVENFDAVENKTSANINIEMTDDNRQAHNAIGYLDNGAENVVIIGAHLDHLGYGENGGSLYRGEPAIHNGADDNASGTSMLMELARQIADSEMDQMNYLFISFSGEEKGLLGANYFTKNPTIDLAKASYMINMDMVGRLDTADNALAINGVGTSPVWDTLLTQIEVPPLDISTTQSGVGPSDHTAFYLSDIPVLHFFTGTHGEYHKPDDDAHLINYDGMEKVFEYITRVNDALYDDGKIAFTKTQDNEGRSTPRFTVTLGVVPDYMYEKGGLKIDGVNDNKPAALAGIQKGDIIIRIGEWEIDDIYAYMDVLSKLKKGDKTELEVVRGEETLTLEIQF